MRENRVFLGPKGGQEGGEWNKREGGLGVGVRTFVLVGWNLIGFETR